MLPIKQNSDLIPMVLWEGQENTPGNNITLKDNMSNYRYIDIYINLSGKLAIQTFDTSDTYYDCKCYNITNNLTGLGLTVAEMRINKASDKLLTLENSSWIAWSWSGNASDNAKKALTDGYIYKIVGRK